MQIHLILLRITAWGRKPLILIFILSLTGCSKIFLSLYGIKKLKPVDEKAISYYAKQYHIPAEDVYELDTSYTAFLYSLDTIHFKEQIKNHLQPLQALYYFKKGTLESFQINCYAGGFPNLKWKWDKTMTLFPPKEQAPLDSIVSLQTQLRHLRPLPQTKAFSPDSYDYFVVVYWSRFMGRQSKRLIRVVQENSKLALDKEVKIVYVNTDNFFLTR